MFTLTRSLAWILCVSLLLAGAAQVSAQDIAAPAPSADPAAAASPPAPTEAPAAAPSASAPAPAAAPAVAPVAAPRAARPQCLIGLSDGVQPAHAATATQLVCAALLDAGADIDAQPVPAQMAQPGAAYRVQLQPLGRILLLSVSYESPLGTPVSTRSMQLSKIEDVPVASPRIAQALISGKQVEQTAKMDTLLGSETRRYEKQYGEMVWGLGILGFGAINTDVVTGYGAYLQGMYETPRYAVGAELRLGGSGESSGDATLGGISVGGRYFFSDGDISPFVGAGLGVLWFETDDSEEYNPVSGYYDYAYYDGSGAAFRVDFGIELLRMHDARFDILLRADLPLFELEGSGGDASQDDKYVVPISLMAAVSF